MLNFKRLNLLRDLIIKINSISIYVADLLSLSRRRLGNIFIDNSLDITKATAKRQINYEA